MSCSYWDNDVCKNIDVSNNIVAGAFWVGFTIQGHECGGTVTSRGNVAHSVAKSKGGVGFIVKPDMSSYKQTT